MPWTATKPLDVHAQEFVPSTELQRIVNSSTAPDVVLPYAMSSFVAPTASLSYQLYTPPPSQALQPAFVPRHLSERSESSADTDRYEDLLSRIEVQQEGLRDVRDSLVGSRFRLRTKRRQLQAAREQAAGQVGETFELMRRHFLVNGLNLPDEMRSAWTKVEATRDTLGELEIAYEQAEENYNKEEWRYTEKEKQFVDGLSQDATISSPHNDAPEASVIPDLDILSFEHPDNDITRDTSTESSLSAPDIKAVQHSPRSVDQSKAIESRAVATEAVATEAPARRSGSTSPRKAAPSLHARATERVASDTTLNHDRVRWAETLKGIDDWMLDALQASAIQQRLLASLVPNTELSDEALLHLALRFWYSTTPEVTEFHTGDTTISGTAASQAVSSSFDRLSPSDSKISGYDTRPSSVNPPFPDDRLADVSTFNNPAQIKRSDLADTPRHVAFQVASSRSDSVSTQPTIMPRGSPSSDLEHTSNTESLSTHPTVMSHTSSLLAIGRSVSIESISTLQSPIAEAFQPSASHLPTKHDIKNGQLHTSLHLEQISEAQHAIASPGHPAQRVLSDIRQNHLPADPRCTDNNQHSAELLSYERLGFEKDLGHRPINGPQRATSHTRYPYAPFIRVRSPQPWNLPLLHLTPLPNPFIDPPSQLYTSDLENIPFVTISDTPLRLPGPLLS